MQSDSDNSNSIDSNKKLSRDTAKEDFELFLKKSFKL